MLIKQFSELERGCLPALRRFADGREVTREGGCPLGARLNLRVELPRALGAAAVVARVARDGAADVDIPLAFADTSLGVDRYEGELPTGELCGPGGGLLFWELLLVRGDDTLFSDTADNCGFSLCRRPARRFRLVVFRPEFRTPRWLAEGTMYHIFLDRFCRGSGAVRLRPGAQENPDWANGVPQFAPRPGDPLPNNVFFGGNLWGVAERLDFLASLGVTVLYLSPVFEAASNHRYDTGDYERVDDYLGGDAAFARLTAAAHRCGMRVVLDGVFNHTGSDSRYFNREGHYPGPGAYQSPESPYAGWYTFRHFPDDYECWWGIPILPRLNQQNPACRHYFTSPEGIACRWLARGADGWRLDVADELPDVFLDELREAVKSRSGGNAALIGEVWENAADKISYGHRRRYLQGGQLDSVMNYPFRTAVLALLRGGDPADFLDLLTGIYATYPRQVCDCLMNLLGTHDTPRILTLLGDGGAGDGKSNAELARLRLPPDRRARALRLLKIASVLQFTVYGFPSVYYGDEAGLEGYGDPFCRMPYPWGREDAGLLQHYRTLGRLRREVPALHGGDFRVLYRAPGCFLYERRRGGSRLLVGVNLSGDGVTLPVPGSWSDFFTHAPCRHLCPLPPLSSIVLVQG